MTINCMIFTGNAGKDMEVRNTPSGKSIGSFSVAVSQGWGDNKKTSWVNCKMFNERAVKLAPFITKGTPVTVQGEFVLETWEKDGVKNSQACCIVNSVQMGQKKEGGSAAPVAKVAEPADMDDDIPF